MRSSLILLGLLLFTFPAIAHAKPLTIASWNFGFLTEENGKGCFPREDGDYENLRKYVARLGADIIAFQEAENEVAAKRVFDPAVYEIEIAEGPVAPTPADECRGQPGQFLTSQKLGFAIRKDLKERGIDYRRLPDIEALSIEESPGRKTRAGVEIAFDYRGTEFRVLAVHLKSGCNDKHLPASGTACGILWQQRQILEDWIDGHTGEGRRAIIVGDFNRRLASQGDEFWAALDDSNPPNADLELVAAVTPSFCGPFDEFIDFIVVDKGADHLVDETSFRIIRFDEPWEHVPADHCPIVVTLDIDTGLSGGYRWIENSAEFGALTHQIYGLAEKQLDELLKDRPADAKPWVVVLDIDETLLKNRGFERASQLQSKKYHECRWEDWVEQEQDWMRSDHSKPKPVPGAIDFVNAVIESGGKVVFITNRPSMESQNCRRENEKDKPLGNLNDKTRATVKEIGFDFGPDKLCVLGRAPVDEESTGQDGYKNDKDRRRELVREGEAEDCWIGQPDEQSARASWGQPHEIVMAIGDNVQDYDGFTQDELGADPKPLMNVLGERFFLLPNPLYGSWR